MDLIFIVGKLVDFHLDTEKKMVEKAALGFRFSEIVLCLILFSVMGADKTQGWSGDSFDHYTECKCSGVKS